MPDHIDGIRIGIAREMLCQDDCRAHNVLRRQHGQPELVYHGLVFLRRFGGIVCGYEHLLLSCDEKIDEVHGPGKRGSFEPEDT